MTVVATPLGSSLSFPSGTEIAEVRYAYGRLTIQVAGFEAGPTAQVEFDDVLAFRVVDERDLLEYWPTCSTPNGWIFEVKSGGWKSREVLHPMALTNAMWPDAREYLVTGEDDCVNVLATNYPMITSL